MAKSLEKQITLRVADSDLEQIEFVVGEVPFQRSAVIRAALRIGIARLEANPALLLQATARNLIETPAGGWLTLEPKDQVDAPEA